MQVYYNLKKCSLIAWGEHKNEREKEEEEKKGFSMILICFFEQEAAIALRHTCESIVLEVRKLDSLEHMVFYDRRLVCIYMCMCVYSCVCVCVCVVVVYKIVNGMMTRIIEFEA